MLIPQNVLEYGRPFMIYNLGTQFFEETKCRQSISKAKAYWIY